MNSLNTIRNRILMAKQYENAITVDSNTYIGIGKPLEWGGSDTVIPSPTETTDNGFDVYRHLVALKKVIGSDINLVVPRVDWANNTVYSEYTEDLQLFAYQSETQITGNVTATSTSLNVVGNGTTFTSNLAVGDFITIQGDGVGIPKIKKEVVQITNNQFMLVNSAFNNTYTQNNIFKVTNTYPYYVNDFYVRNIYDQVFKCLLNNNGVASTVMPEIDVGGSLPQNPYIQTSDGYRWKYLYTIPAGLKEKFFTSDWMPVINNNIVNDAAIDGRLDIIKIISGGSGYLAGSNSTSANIISISGDGTGANVTANVTSGVIDKVNIINGGTGYKTATITVSDATKLSGSVANLIAVISPQGGHGFDAELELGATNLMICTELDGDELGKFPTENSAENFDFRQISLIKNIVDVNGDVANNTRYNATYVVRVSSPPGGSRFNLDEYVYQGSNFASATYSAVVAFWDETTNELWLNNITGTLDTTVQLRSTDTQDLSVIILDVNDPEVELYSGEVLYIRNNESIVRDDDQTEQIKIVVSF